MKFRDMIKKADIFLLIFLLVLGFASLLLLKSGNAAGESVEITVDGKPYGSYPLGTDRVIDVNTKFGYNQITISGGTVWVSDSNCAGHDCESFGAISMPKQAIMCLPHRLIVTISGESDVDAVLY